MVRAAEYIERCICAFPAFAAPKLFFLLPSPAGLLPGELESGDVRTAGSIGQAPKLRKRQGVSVYSQGRMSHFVASERSFVLQAPGAAPP